MQSRQQDSRDERPLGELFADLAREIGDQMRQELNLAKTEMTQKATRVGRNIGALAVGGAVVYAGFLALVAAAILVLAAIGVPWWLSALIVGVVVVAVGALFVQRSLTALRQTDLAPRRTMQTLRDDTQLVKERTP
jgi:uncharacterized membrane protein YqjE